MHTEREDPVPDGRVDHLWIRVRDPAASKRFYTTIAPHAGLRIGVDEPDHVQLLGEDFSFSLIDDERPLTEHVHLAFPAPDDATVRSSHSAAFAAGTRRYPYLRVVVPAAAGSSPVAHPSKAPAQWRLPSSRAPASRHPVGMHANG